jgi:hypothetical protein
MLLINADICLHSAFGDPRGLCLHSACDDPRGPFTCRGAPHRLLKLESFHPGAINLAALPRLYLCSGGLA